MTTTRSSLTLLAMLFLTVSAVLAQVRPATPNNGRTIRLEDAREATAPELARFEDALGAHDGELQKAVASHFVLVRTAGTIFNNPSLGIWGVIHTTIPAGSLVGLRTRKYNNVTHSYTFQTEGVGTWDEDLLAGSSFIVKEPGGSLMFNTMKQYEVVVVYSGTTTVDYIPAISGGSFISNSPTFSFSPLTGDALLQITTLDDGRTDAVVINGMVVPANALTTVGSSVVVDLTKFNLCFGLGDISVTVVKGGKSDTTQFRYPQGVTQTCGGNSPDAPKG